MRSFAALRMTITVLITNGGKQMKQQQYIWLVELNGREAEVTAQDKLSATKAAAKQLGVLWSRTARDMQVLRLRKADGKEGRQR